MNIKEICSDILDIYEKAEKEKRDRSLAIQLIYKMKLQIDFGSFSKDDLSQILETSKKIASTKKNYKQILEKELLSLISFLPHALWMETKDNVESQKFDRNLKTNEAEIAESLINFSKEIYEIRLDRDAFSGKRRGYSIQILASLSDYFDVPEFLDLCSKSIKSKSKIEFLESIECLKDYCLERDETPSKAIIEVIDQRILKTKIRSEATSGLNLQVETGLICELQALSRLDEWKEKNEVW